MIRVNIQKRSSTNCKFIHFLKILHITASYKPAYIYGGPIYSVAALCGEVIKAKGGRRKAEGISSVENEGEVESERALLEITVYTTLANGLQELPYMAGEEKVVDGVLVKYFKRLTKDHSHFSPALLWWLWKHAKEYNVIHIHSWWNLVSMGSVLVCLLKGIKPILSPRGMLGNYTFTGGKKTFHQWIGKRLLRRCDFHATTMMEAEEIRKRLSFDSAQDDSTDFTQNDSTDSAYNNIIIVDLMDGKVESGKWKVENGKWKVGSGKSEVERGRIFVVHNMVKLPEVLPVKTRTFDGTLKLIFLSRIHHKKGLELLLDVLAEVPFAFSLSIVGNGESDYVESLKLKVESLKLKKHVVWMGPVYGEEKYKLLADHDVFVLPSFNENFANVVVESIAVGTPVIISDQVGLCYYVERNKLGLVHTNDINALKNALTAFIHQQPFLVEDIKKDFSPLHLRKQYLEMYHAI